MPAPHIILLPPVATKLVSCIVYNLTGVGGGVGNGVGDGVGVGVADAVGVGHCVESG